MSYRNKTYIAFASEDILKYRLMEAWRENSNIDFNFFDAHDLFVSRDTSKPETIKANLRQRMLNAKQIILLGSETTKAKGSDGNSFLAYEIQTMLKLNLPIIVANLNGSRVVNRNFIPDPILKTKYYTMSVSFQPAIIKYALDNYAATFSTSNKTGNYLYDEYVYKQLGL